jgi:hypothetical protein
LYHSTIHNSLEARRKLLPKWSIPCRITKQLCNSYKLENLDGTPIPGEFHARCLRAFHPKDGTKLAEEQKQQEREQTRKGTEENQYNEDAVDENMTDEGSAEDRENREQHDETDADSRRVVDEDVAVF